MVEENPTSAAGASGDQRRSAMFRVPNDQAAFADAASAAGAVFDTFTYDQLASVLRVKVDTLYRWVRSGRIRQPVLFGDRPRWSLATVRKIVAEGTKPVGTFPPVVARPRGKTATKGNTVTARLGHQVKTNGKAARPGKGAKPAPSKKGGAK